MIFIYILGLIVGFYNIVMGGSIIWNDFKPDKKSTGWTYIALGFFMIIAFLGYFKDSQG